MEKVLLPRLVTNTRLWDITKKHLRIIPNQVIDKTEAEYNSNFALLVSFMVLEHSIHSNHRESKSSTNLKETTFISSISNDSYKGQRKMGRTSEIMRRSIFTFLKDFQYFTLFPSLIAFPYAVSILLVQSLVSSSHFFALVHGRVRSLLLAAGFPLSSELFAVLNLKLSETIYTFLLVLPFSLSFLLLAKASVIRALDHRKFEKAYPYSSWISVFNTLCIMQLWNSLVMLSANAMSFCILSISFNLFDVLGLSSRGFLLLLSATGAIIYSIILAHSYITCNLALVLSGMEKQGGFTLIVKAFFLIRGRTVTALSLAVLINFVLAAIEALFQYRVTKVYHNSMALSSFLVLEGMLVAYLYSILLVLDTISGCVFAESCRNDPPERLPVACVPKDFSGASLKFLAGDQDQGADPTGRRKDLRHPQMEMFSNFFCN